MNDKRILETLQQQYGAVAKSDLSNESSAAQAVARAFGYSADDLASLPPQANMGLSCGNPVALAALRPGEVVLDLGCGGGLDVLLAAKRVGPSGRAIGVDMTPEMIERARAGAAQVNASNVEFHLASIDQLPVTDETVDCVLSNCVINLAPDKPRVFLEILRVLKPGGRIAISDIALRKPLPPEIESDVQAYVGCIGGAVLIADYERMLREAGFAAVVVSETGTDLNVYAQAGSSGCCTASAGSCCASEETEQQTTPVHDGLTQTLQAFNANEYAASVRIHAVKAETGHAQPTGETTMIAGTVQVYDKPMCCSTGVCGPQVDPVLPRFAADLDWLNSQGPRVDRFNLAQQPQEFIQNKVVHELLSTQGTDCLPLVIVDGRIVSRRRYPTREELASWTGVEQAALPVLADEAACCGGTCC